MMPSTNAGTSTTCEIQSKHSECMLKKQWTHVRSIYIIKEVNEPLQFTFTIRINTTHRLGLVNLKRYFELIIFQAYLESTPPDTIRTVETFESYVKKRPVFKTFENEMKADGVLSLKRLERMDVAEGIALPDEIAQTVANRSGNILSASTILKSDFFSNLQKMSLPEYVDY